MTGGVPERYHDVTRYSNRAVTIIDAERLGSIR
jgi:cobalamin biosynthesis protein CobT